MLDTNPVRRLTLSELESGLPPALESPKDEGTLDLIVRRPAIGRRDVLDEADLDVVTGLVGDAWNVRRRTPSLNTN